MLNKEEILRIFEKLDIDSETVEIVAKYIPEIVTLIETDSENPELEKKIKTLRILLNEFYTKKFSAWEPKRKSEFSNLIEQYDLRKYKHVISPLVLTDDSPWQDDRLEYVLTKFRLLPTESNFTYYNMLLVKDNRNKQIYFRRFAIQFKEDLTTEQFEKSISGLESRIEKTSTEAKEAVQNAMEAKKAIQSATMNLVTVLGIFAAIISFIIITSNVVIGPIIALPIILIFGGVLFLFVILLKFLSVYGEKWWHWIMIIVICIFLIWAGLRTFYNQSIIPF